MYTHTYLYTYTIAKCILNGTMLVACLLKASQHVSSTTTNEYCPGYPNQCNLKT